MKRVIFFLRINVPYQYCSLRDTGIYVSFKCTFIRYEHNEPVLLLEGTDILLTELSTIDWKNFNPIAEQTAKDHFNEFIKPRL